MIGAQCCPKFPKCANLPDMDLLMPGGDALDAYFDRLPEVLSVEECAEVLRRSPKTVLNRLKLPDGTNPRKIPGYKAGSTWLVMREDLRAYVRRGANLPPDEAEDHVLS